MSSDFSFLLSSQPSLHSQHLIAFEKNGIFRLISANWANSLGESVRKHLKSKCYKSHVIICKTRTLISWLLSSVQRIRLIGIYVTQTSDASMFALEFNYEMQMVSPRWKFQIYLGSRKKGFDEGWKFESGNRKITARWAGFSPCHTPQENCQAMHFRCWWRMENADWKVSRSERVNIFRENQRWMIKTFPFAASFNFPVKVCAIKLAFPSEGICYFSEFVFAPA